MTARSIFATILAVGIICRLAFVFLTPIFYAPDEHSHFNYIRYLSEHRSFPIQTSRMGDPANEWEYFQPPLYYLALVPVYRAVQSLFQNQAATVFALRFCSLLLWLVNVRFGVLWLRRLQIKDEVLWVSALGLVCLLPTYTFISAVINNDNLLAAIGGAVVCLLARREQSLKTTLSLGLLLGVGLLVKQSALVLVAAIVLVPVFHCLRRRIKLLSMLWHVGLVLVPAAVIYFPWALRNWRVYGTLTPERLSANPSSWPSPLYGMASAVHNLIKSFWAVSGISNDVGYPLAALGMIFTVLALIGLIRGWKQTQLREALVAESSEPLLAALLLAVIVNVVLVLRFGYLTGMGQGRHLFVLLHPIALMLALGSRASPFQNSIARVMGFWIIYAVTFVVFSLCRFP
jgi:4-amino-4-deoxy-L-arabinose transferase-like glycosyltransferase